MRCGANPPVTGALEKARETAEKTLREQYGTTNRSALRELPVFREYAAYYRRFEKSYHVLMQLESVAQKGRSIPPVSSLVTAMFIAELESGVLSAGYDLGRLALPMTVRPVEPGERYALLGNQKEQEGKPGDMALADAQGIVGTILYGPDHRTRIDADTTDALFVVYGVPGLHRTAIDRHLDRLRDLVRLALPDALEGEREVVEAQP